MVRRSTRLGSAAGLALSLLSCCISRAARTPPTNDTESWTLPEPPANMSADTWQLWQFGEVAYNISFYPGEPARLAVQRACITAGQAPWSEECAAVVDVVTGSMVQHHPRLPERSPETEPADVILPIMGRFYYRHVLVVTEGGHLPGRLFLTQMTTIIDPSQLTAYLNTNTKPLDLVLLSGLLRHEDATAAVRRVLRVLRPGGTVLLHGTCPNSRYSACRPGRPGEEECGGAVVGDVWRAALALRTDPWLDVVTMDVAQGITLVRQDTNNTHPLPLEPYGSDPAGLKYDEHLAEQEVDMLRMVTMKDALRWLERCEEARVDQGRRLDHLGGLALLARDAGRGAVEALTTTLPASVLQEGGWQQCFALGVEEDGPLGCVDLPPESMEGEVYTRATMRGQRNASPSPQQQPQLLRTWLRQGERECCLTLSAVHTSWPIGEDGGPHRAPLFLASTGTLQPHAPSCPDNSSASSAVPHGPSGREEEEEEAEEEEDLRQYLLRLKELTLPEPHVQYLRSLKASGFEPRVIYDIGACVLHWARVAKELWPSARLILFDAYRPAEFLYVEGGYDYHLGVLSDRDGRQVRFYQNDYHPGGNSYYREVGGSRPDFYFPQHRFINATTRSLDSVVRERGWPLPDLIKVDVQGAERDILSGARGLVLPHAEHLIVEMQHDEYNQGAPRVDETLPWIESLGFQCTAPMFSRSSVDGDYGFHRAAGGRRAGLSSFASL